MIDFNNLFNNFKSKKILIVGDVMIDSYMWGKVNRMSPEAPVPVVDVNKYEKKLGGAGNVALNIKSLGAEPLLCSVIGNDTEGELFIKLLKEQDISFDSIQVNENRKTTVKTRIIANEKHQIRIDEEDTNEIEDTRGLMKIIESHKEIDAIILEDYNKGVLTKQLIRNIIDYAKKRQIPIIVDPKVKNFKAYKNCTLFKPNLNEIKKGMDISFDEYSYKDLEEITEITRKELNSDAILLTLSSNGICIKTKELFKHIPVSNPNKIDVSGAGDTVISVATLCLTESSDFDFIARLSNLAGSIVCQKVGVVPIDKNTLIEEAKKYLS